MHSASSSLPSASNNSSYSCSTIPTLRRPTRPSNIDLSTFDMRPTSIDTCDVGIYSAPIHYLKTNDQFQDNFNSSSYYSNMSLAPSSHAMTHYTSTDAIESYSDVHHTPRTFPLQPPPGNHCESYFHFPPASIFVRSYNGFSYLTSLIFGYVLQTHVKSNELGDNRTAWYTSIFDPSMIKRINSGTRTISINHEQNDDDPSASIDALVGRM
jgi:hypothetical protein